MKTEHKKFKPFDRVLVRDAYGKWRCDIYSHYDKDENNNWVIGLGWTYDDDIIPYEGNEYLVGTTDKPEEEVILEEDELGFASDIISDDALDWDFIPFVITKEGEYPYFIRYSDFNPYDMEETKKHILYVEDGKIVRYQPE